MIINDLFDNCFSKDKPNKNETYYQSDITINIYIRKHKDKNQMTFY